MILEVNELGFKYEDEDILKGINFVIHEGDFVGILGPNGCGKTTLINNINRWLKPHKGSILVDDIDTFGLNPKELAKLVATVPQDIPFQGGFTVEEVVMMGRNPYLKSFQSLTKEDLDSVNKAMESMDVYHLRKKRIDFLSGGERQRVSISRALAQQPRILLLDEPTSHLDINYQWELLGMLKSLCAANKLTIIAVLHDINLASLFCDKVILLKNKTIFKMGTLLDVINEKNIKEVFNIDVEVRLHGETLRPNIVLLNRKSSQNSPKPYQNIHVISGGGEGEAVLNYLSHRGYSVSVGVLNVSDTDWKTAKRLGLKIIEEKPFSSISDERMKENIEAIGQSEAIVVANIPFGNGNLNNLSCLQNISPQQQLIFLEEDRIENRDYTGGKASELYEVFREKATVVRDLKELKSLL